MPSTMYSSWSRGFSRIRGRTSRKWASLDQRADITRRSSITTINWPMAVVTSRRETLSDQTKRVGVCTRIRTEDLLKLSRGIGPEFIWRYVREWSASATKLHGRACTSLPISLSLSIYLSLSLSLFLSRLAYPSAFPAAYEFIKGSAHRRTGIPSAARQVPLIRLFPLNLPG
jgi:hypothetical protein